MTTITTRQGTSIQLISERDLRSPVVQGEHVRAYCHIHGSDHQRSLSITRATGWGHCFNAACDVTVLVEEWNRPVAYRLLHGLSHESAAGRTASASLQAGPTFVQPLLLPPPKYIPSWQQEECAALHELDGDMRYALTATAAGKRYLRERGIPLAVAVTSGVGYLPPDLLNEAGRREHRQLLARWTNRVLFPLTSPDGTGYIGRSLWRWRPGMTETVHKRILEQRAGPRRWIKTNPSGWFGVEADQIPSTVLLVEGAFDRLTLLTAGFQPAEVIALVGTAAPMHWLFLHAKTVVLALDGDEGGRVGSMRLASQLTQWGIKVYSCFPAQDQWGKDWNERWQHLGERSVTAVKEIFSQATGSIELLSKQRRPAG